MALKEPQTTRTTTTALDTWIVGFGGSAPLVPHPDKELMGGKGLGLQEMSNVGIDVPPGFTLATTLCQEYQTTGEVTDNDWIRN
jgi:pyruvate, orthophosphate dikinase